MGRRRDKWEEGGRDRRGRQGRERGRGRLGYLSRDPEFLVTPLDGQAESIMPPGPSVG